MTGDFFIGNDNSVYLDGLYDNVLAAYVNDATVELVIREIEDDGSVGDVVGSAVTLSYLTATNGNYRGNIEDGVSITDGRTYELTITATASGDRVGSWRAEKPAKYRT